jgi:hypothetical protein
MPLEDASEEASFDGALSPPLAVGPSKPMRPHAPSIASTSGHVRPMIEP